MKNHYAKVVNGTLRYFFGHLDVTPFATGPPTAHGQKQRYPGRFVHYLNYHYPLDGKRILEMFSGAGELKKYGAVTTDIREETGADIVAPYDDLKIKGRKFDLVLADPPYNHGYQSQWITHSNKLPVPKRIQREGAKVVKVGGLIMILHIMPIPNYKLHNLETVAYHPVFVGGNNSIRCLSVFRKRRAIHTLKGSDDQD